MDPSVELAADVETEPVLAVAPPTLPVADMAEVLANAVLLPVAPPAEAVLEAVVVAPTLAPLVAALFDPDDAETDIFHDNHTEPGSLS